MEQIIVVRLCLALEAHFDAGELRELAFVLAVDYDSLPGRTCQTKGRELIRHLQRRDRLADLVMQFKRLRPNYPL